MSFVDRIRSWWNRDKVERAEEETGITPAERDHAEEDFEGRKDEVSAREHFEPATSVDFESDSEPPRHP